MGWRESAEGGTLITLIVGGARSGKTQHAQQLAVRSTLAVVYLATAQAGDPEMAVRIERHQAVRPADWLTIEEPLALGAALRAHARADRCIVVDCLTLWLTNLILADSPDRSGIKSIDAGPYVGVERADFLDALRTVAGEIIVVSNEVGMGVVPLGPLNRLFVDEAGRLNQAVAQYAECVISMVAGCPVYAKGAL